ncbi:MAG: hypothetical protein ACRDNH_06175 [Gaiellaceae bacterium]
MIRYTYPGTTEQQAFSDDLEATLVSFTRMLTGGFRDPADGT